MRNPNLPSPAFSAVQSSNETYNFLMPPFRWQVKLPSNITITLQLLIFLWRESQGNGLILGRWSRLRLLSVQVAFIKTATTVMGKTVQPPWSSFQRHTGKRNCHFVKKKKRSEIPILPSLYGSSVRSLIIGSRQYLGRDVMFFGVFGRIES